jgi:hypothetical protein
MSQQPTIEQLDPNGNWRAFARRHPEAAKAINAEARRILAHNRHVDRTMSHSQAGMHGKFNHASVLRSNIVTGYTPDNLWPRIARQWARQAA